MPTPDAPGAPDAALLADREALFEDLVGQACGDPTVSRSTMMGLPCLRRDGAFVASLDRRSGDLVVKLSEDRVTELVALGSGAVFAPAGRTFREWVAIADEDAWAGMLDEALRFAARGAAMTTDRREAP